MHPRNDTGINPKTFKLKFTIVHGGTFSRGVYTALHILFDQRWINSRIELTRSSKSRETRSHNEIAYLQRANRPNRDTDGSRLVIHARAWNIANLYKLRLFIETSRTDDLSKPAARCLVRSLFFLPRGSFTLSRT